MMKTNHIFLVLTVLLCLTISSKAAVHYTVGHADVGINYEEGAWDLHIHAEGADIGGLEDVDGEFEPDAIITVIPDHAEHIRETGSQWDFIGVAAGQPLWRLPQHENDGGDHSGHDHEIPFLGIGTHELASDIFVDDKITLSLVSASFFGSGPGHFSLWNTDEFNQTVVYMSSFDPSVETDLNLYAGLHGHYNWDFSALGTYEIELMASGELVTGGTTSGTAVYTFQVVPEPASVSLLALGAVALLRKK
ncbi:MAG: choice-of-anchor M domain-containing protein [Planctomycetota bacterium]